MFCMHMCPCTPCIPGAHEGQKRVTEPLELELQTAVSHHMGPLDGQPMLSP